jgi:hypothetical protein
MLESGATVLRTFVFNIYVECESWSAGKFYVSRSTVTLSNGTLT